MVKLLWNPPVVIEELHCWPNKNCSFLTCITDRSLLITWETENINIFLRLTRRTCTNFYQNQEEKCLLKEWCV